MRRSTVTAYVSPNHRAGLTLRDAQGAGEEIETGELVAANGDTFPIRQGIARLVPGSAQASPDVARNREYYAAVGDLYDKGMDWLFKSFRLDEAKVRDQMIDWLELEPGSRVLETGAGTCRDSTSIAARLGDSGQLFATDLSAEMLLGGQHRLEASGALRSRIELATADATCLPFSDGFFDAAYHFGGLNLFSDRALGLREMARVVRPGGKVVVGDEGVAPWLRGTEYGKILLNSNPLYEHAPPLDLLPITANDAAVHWVMHGSFYVIEFRVGAEPALDLDLLIPGARGGTHRSRYFGRLEGVTPATKAAVAEAAKRAGVSIHDYLEKVLSEATRS